MKSIAIAPSEVTKLGNVIWGMLPSKDRSYSALVGALTVELKAHGMTNERAHKLATKFAEKKFF